jgi:hypothetical protein
MRTEKEILDKIETHLYLERKDIGTIKRYVAAAFWILTIVSALVVISHYK